MKKSLMAIAVLGAFAGSSMAADVTMYGVVDLGMRFSDQQYDADRVNPAKAVHSDEQSFSMDSGNNSASRFGIRGTEDLGNGMTVGFKLENGFKADTGALNSGSQLFDRESTLFVEGAFGTVYAGRMGTLISDAGSVGFFGSMASAMGTGWSDNIAGHNAVFASYASRTDNTLAYVSPEFGGLTIYAQYAMGDNGVENKAAADRYAAIGAEFKAGALDLGALVDWTNKSTKAVYVGNNVRLNSEVDDAMTVSLAGSYDFGVVKPYLAVQYYKNASDIGGVFARSFEKTSNFKDDDDMIAGALGGNAFDGYGVHLGASAPLLGGTVLGGIGYGDGDGRMWQGLDADTKIYTASLGYEYPLSKRTKLYGGAGYVKSEQDMMTDKGTLTDKYEAYDVVFGMVHTF